jgi:hypothetical protein
MEKKFVLVVGSGVHHRVKDKQDPGLLASWDLLLDAVARKEKIPLGNRMLPPSARWEEILLGKVKQDLSRKERVGPVSKKEVSLRNVAEKILKEQLKHHAIDEKKASIFNQGSISDVISLNFESSWLGEAGRKIELVAPSEIPEWMEGAAKIEISRLYSRARIENGPRIWFPNGHISQKNSIRLGYRDFGLQANTLRLAFENFKIWERKILGYKSSQAEVVPKDEKAYKTVLDAYLSIERKRSKVSITADHWVTAFMLLEPIFLGVGMSPDEQGLWWLLHQRARNLARVPTARPPRILKVCPPCIEAEYGRFLTGNPVLEPIWCRSWEEGWAAVEEILAGKLP